MSVKKLISSHSPFDIEIDLPSSKSVSNRVLIINSLCDGCFSSIENLSQSDDTKVLSEALKKSNQIIIDIGAAGTAMRFLTAYFAQKDGCEVLLTGSQRMKERPIAPLVGALRQLGADISYAEKEGFPPLKIKGKELEGGKIKLPANVSSQYISALMMIAPKMKKGLEISLEGEVVSLPYIEMTKKIMEHFGAKVLFEKQVLTIFKSNYNSTSFSVEADWSAASYWYALVLAQKQGTVLLRGLKKDSLQGDRAICDIFAKLGVETQFVKEGARLFYSPTSIDEFEYDFVNQPDLAQTVVVACCLEKIRFCFSGLQSLKIKETNRILALQNEAKKIGYILEEPSEGLLCWRGKTCAAEQNPFLKTYSDHRMAMAFAPAALKFLFLEIENPEVVSKSYPTFWSDLKKADFRLE